MYVDADTVHYTNATQWLSADGNVLIQVKGDREATLHAERVEGNLDSGELAASQQVLIEHAGATFEAENAIYNLETGAFMLDEARGKARLEQARETVFIHAQGRHARREGGVLYVISGRLTTCDKEHSHYAIHGEKIEIAPGKHVVIEGAQLQFLGLRLPRAPTIKLPLGEGPRRSPFPRFGYSRRYGPFLADTRAIAGRGGHFRSELDYYLTTRRGVLGSLTTSYFGHGWSACVGGGYEEYLRDDVTDVLYLDTLPEFRLSAENSLAGLDDLTYFGSGSIGCFREEPTSARATRQRVEAGLRYGDAQRRALEGRWGELALRQSFYNTGDEFRDLEASVGVGRRWSHRFRGAVTLIGHVTEGRTPFEFDDVDIPIELRGNARVGVTRNWYVGALGRYDVERRELRDYTLTLTRRLHCLGFSLHYRNIGSDFGVSLDVNGVTNDLPATD